MEAFTAANAPFPTTPNSKKRSRSSSQLDTPHSGCGTGTHHQQSIDADEESFRKRICQAATTDTTLTSDSVPLGQTYLTKSISSSSCALISEVSTSAENPPAGSSYNIPTLDIDKMLPFPRSVAIEKPLTFQSDESSGSVVPPLSTTSSMSESEVPKLQHELAALRSQLDLERSVHARVRQDMLLHAMLVEKESKRHLEAGLRTNVRLRSAFAKMESRVNVALERYEIANTELQCALTALAASRAEVGTLRALNLSLDEDIRELHQVNMDERNHICRLRLGLLLPPAYGSLDDIDNTPFSGLFEDGGPAATASIEHTLNTRLKIAFADPGLLFVMTGLTQEHAEQLHEAMLVGMFLFLADSCRKYSQLIDKILPPSQPNKPQPDDGDGPGASTDDTVDVTSPDVLEMVETPGDRLINFTIQKTWYIFARLEGIEQQHLSPRFRADLSSAVVELDDVLLASLRRAFSSCESSVRKIHGPAEYQLYCTQVELLRDRFATICTLSTMSLFENSIEWLNEQIEAARVRRACAEPGG